MASDLLRLDSGIGRLVIEYIPGAPFLRGLDYLDVNGNPATWPAAPVLVFDSPDVPDITATLTAVGAVANARATWSMTALQVNALHASNSKVAHLTVGGVEWFKGGAVVDA